MGPVIWDLHVPFAVLALLVVLVVSGWYLSYSASRLDRLHHKVEAARTALDVQLVRRSAAAVEASAHLDPASALLVTDAATRAMTASEHADTDQARAARDPLEVPPELESVENDLTRALTAAFGAWVATPDDGGTAPGDPLAGDPLAGDPLARDPFAGDPLAGDPFAEDSRRVLAQACVRVQMARRFHNDAVAQTQRVRRKRVVRWARLAGRAPLPQMIEFDDAVPPGVGD